jgi:hypothetical protein
MKSAHDIKKGQMGFTMMRNRSWRKFYPSIEEGN